MTLSSPDLINRFKKILEAPAAVPLPPPPVPEAPFEPESTAKYIIESPDKPVGFETDIAFRQAAVATTMSTLETQVNELLNVVGHQTRFLTAQPVELLPEPMHKIQDPERAPGAMRPSDAAKWLAVTTGKPWTMHLLHKFAKRMDWRPESADQDRDHADPRYFAEIIDVVRGLPTSYYTERALNYIVSLPDMCWATANEKA
jgi:hypothetical protein